MSADAERGSVRFGPVKRLICEITGHSIEYPEWDTGWCVRCGFGPWTKVVSPEELVSAVERGLVAREDAMRHLDLYKRQLDESQRLVSRLSAAIFRDSE